MNYFDTFVLIEGNPHGPFPHLGMLNEPPCQVWNPNQYAIRKIIIITCRMMSGDGTKLSLKFDSVGCPHCKQIGWFFRKLTTLGVVSIYQHFQLPVIFGVSGCGVLALIWSIIVCFQEYNESHCDRYTLDAKKNRLPRKSIWDFPLCPLLTCSLGFL